MSLFQARRLRILSNIAFVGLFLSTVYWAFSSWTESLYFDLGPWVLPFYFVTSAFTLLIILNRKWVSGLSNKIGIVVAHSFLTRIISIILFYPGMSGDSWYHLAHSRTWFNTGLYYFSFLPTPLRALTPEIGTAIGRMYVYQRAAAQHTLVVAVSRMLSIDVFWVHIGFIGAIWSLFIPIVAFKSTKALGASNRAGLFAAILMANAPVLFAWSFIEVPNSLGFLFFAVTVYFSTMLSTSNAKLKYGLLAAVASLVSLLSHNMTGFVSIAVLWLALALVKYNSDKNDHKRMALVTLFLGLAASCMLLPATTVAMQLIYPIRSNLSLQKFLGLNIYDIVLTNYSSYNFIEGVTYGTLTLLAVIGIALKTKSHRGKAAKIFLALAFAVLVAQYRVFFYFIDPPPFGVHRLLIFVPFVIAPFAALAIDRQFKWFTRTATTDQPESKNPSTPKGKIKLTTRQGLAIALIGIGLSAYFTQAAWAAWEGIAARGAISIVSVHSMEAAKLIHEEYLRTGEKYVVVSDQLTEMAGIGLVGRYNPNEYFMISIGAHKNKILYKQAIGDISVEPMFEAATYNEATIAYLVTSRWSARWYLGSRADYTAIIYQLDKLYERFNPHVLGSGDGQINIFRYRVPYKPLEGAGPNMTVIMDSQETQMVTEYTYRTRSRVTYTLNLTGATTYSVTGWPLSWSYESIFPTPIPASIDANNWINFTASSPNTSYTIAWVANEIYPDVFWKDDSFTEGWETTGGGKAIHSFTSDGDIGTITVQGEARDYILYKKQVLPFQNGTLTLMVRLRVVDDTICYISVFDDTVDPNNYVFFSYGISTLGDYKTILYPLPQNSTFTRIRLTVRTPDGSPSSVNLDYIMLVQT